MKYKQYKLCILFIMLFMLVGMKSADAMTLEEYETWYKGYKFKTITFNGDVYSFRNDGEYNAEKWVVQIMVNGVPKTGYGYPAYPFIIYGEQGYWYQVDYNESQGMLYLHRCYIARSGETFTKNSEAWAPLEEVPVEDIEAPPTDYEELIKGKVVITIPAYDGFKDTTPVQVIAFNYGVPLPSSGSPDDITIKIEGGVSGTGQVIGQSGYVKDGYYYGYGKVTRELNPGVNTIIVKVTSNGVTYSASRVIERLIGQVDEDGDGIDDRTGLPIWPEYPDTGDDNAPQPPAEGATIFDYIKYLTDSVMYAMNQLVLMLKGFMGGLAQLTQVLSQFFTFMPTQFSAIIILGLIMAVILRVVGR